MKLTSAALLFFAHLSATLLSMPFFHSAMDKLYRSVGNAPAQLSFLESIGALVFQLFTIPLLVSRQLDHSYFYSGEDIATVQSAILRLSANSLVYVLVAFLIILAWKTISRRRREKA
ncbi:MAG: hypothetical protein ABI946_11330 [Chthoniobacterales bacterium]